MEKKTPRQKKRVPRAEPLTPREKSTLSKILAKARAAKAYKKAKGG